MKIKSKYNIGDKVYVPYREEKGEGFGIIIRKVKINEIVFNSKNIYYKFDYTEFVRDEPFVFSTLNSAKKYAYTMINTLSKNNKKEINKLK